MRRLLVALCSYVSTSWATNRFRSRASFERWQQDHLLAWLAKAPKRVDFYKKLPATLEAFPIIDKQIVMSCFDAFNVAGITTAQGWKAFDNDRRIGAFTVGASTGTSGNRGLFVISDDERFSWLGVMLAKALPTFWLRKERIAVVLPLHTRLYEAANETRRLKMRFFNLTEGVGYWLEDLVSFAPSVLIAPPKMLRFFAEQGVALRPRKIFSAAERLDPIDRRVIETHFGSKLGEIYMATEGLIGVSCHLGAMHLAEDTLYFEFEGVGGNTGVVSPIITHFRRTTQIMVRYRMNDLLRLSPTACACGSPLRVASEIIGRMDDIFHIPRVDGEIMITPDILRNAILDSDRRIDDFRLRQTEADTIELVLPDTLESDGVGAARHALEALFEHHNVHVKLSVRTEILKMDATRKLRRVENCVAKRQAF